MRFDLRASGNAPKVQWVESGTNDGFLVLDLNRNGIIDDGSELFGEGTEIISTGKRATNGYTAIEQYDSNLLGGNGDGVLTSKDAIWGDLKVWIDVNADGVSQDNEISSIHDFSMKKIQIFPRGSKRNSTRTDEAGNKIPFWSWIITDRRGKPRAMKMVDIFFRVISK